MSNLTATTPTEVSATYDLWSVSNLTIAGSGCVQFGQTAPNPPVVVNVTLVKARILADGVTWEQSPLATDVARLTIPDVYAYIATNTAQAQAVAAALTAILAALQAYGTQQGVL